MIRLYFISDRTLTPSLPRERPLIEAIEAGVDMVQVREKDLAARDVLDITRGIVTAASGRTAEVYVNSRFDIAAAAGAAGVHLPALGLSARDTRRAAPARLKVGVSTHSMAEALDADENGADFITFGPIYETRSKSAYGPPAGLRALHGVLAAVSVPVYALGGITLDNVEQLLELPVTGVAMISAIALAPDRGEAVAAFRAAARRARGGEA